MGFKIQNNLQAVSSLNNVEKTQKLMSKLVERLASGERSSSAADDASGMAASSRMRAEVASMEAASRNIQIAETTAQAADGVINQIEQMAERMRELAVQAGHVGADRNALDGEAQQLMAEMNRTAASASFNGEPLFDGNFSQAIQVGGENNADSRIEMSLPNLSTQALAGGQAFSVNLQSPEGARAALDSITSVLDTLSESRGEIGSISNRLAVAETNLTVQIENKVASESVIRDADIASEIADFTKTQIMQDASLAIHAQASVAPAKVLELLK